MDGEEEHFGNSIENDDNTNTHDGNGNGTNSIEEATGFSTWTTVTVKRTTVRQELKQERARLRQARQDAAAAEAKQQKEAEVRRMEEAKIANADDSALGAYDIWSRGQKEGYKGVHVHRETKISAADRTKKLAVDAPAAFKKFSGKRKQKIQQSNRRTTSADDD